MLTFIAIIVNLYFLLFNYSIKTFPLFEHGGNIYGIYNEYTSITHSLSICEDIFSCGLNICNTFLQHNVSYGCYRPYNIPQECHNISIMYFFTRESINHGYVFLILCTTIWILSLIMYTLLYIRSFKVTPTIGILDDIEDVYISQYSDYLNRSKYLVKLYDIILFTTKFFVICTCLSVCAVLQDTPLSLLTIILNCILILLNLLECKSIFRNVEFIDKTIDPLI